MEEDARVVRLFSSERQRNHIQTNKYTWYNFLPKNLLEQFSQSGNLYFLMVAVGQLIPSISNTQGKPATLLPLSAVVSMQAVKDLFEDSARVQSDKVENNRTTIMVDSGLNETAIAWGDVSPGMVLKVMDGERIPADCLLLVSSRPDGHCCVETANLDGETNLKKKAAAMTSEEFHDAAWNCRRIGPGCSPSLLCEAPNGDLYSFKSSLCLAEEQSRGLGIGSLLLRGTSLQQTPWVYCMAVYVGKKTRSFKNTRAARFKGSALDEILNKVVAMIFGAQIGICILISICSLFWQGLAGHRIWYLEGVPRYLNPFRQVGIWFLMLNSVVPISLMITTTVVKFAQGKMMEEDTGSFSKGRKAQVHTSQVIDSLGKVTHVFSDKTGTLTQNIMEYKGCSVGQIYGLEGLRDTVLHDAHVHMDATYLSKALKGLDGGKRETLTSFFMCHALCHTVEPASSSEAPYNASSPDELALVCAARALGLEFLRLAENQMQLGVSKVFTDLLGPFGYNGSGPFQAELLDVCEFDNVRKRMSVLLRMPSGEILLYVKGADSSILPHVLEQAAKEQCDSHLLTFARQGLRTLCLAERVLSEEEFQDWHSRFKKAKATISEDRADLIHDLSNEVETKRPVKLLGATAIDDKLQEEVPETIEQLRHAGVRVWVLTGDKVDTAISIAMSCKLLTEDMNNFIIDNTTEQRITDILQDALEAESPALTIEGSKLIDAMEDDESRSLLFHAGQRCRSVVCCRVSPKQKADVVDLVKLMDEKAVTLSIGDGANDVSMIVAAHVGVGLCGKEGAQAARSGDFALAEFRLLRRAVFGHGREAYRRNSMVCLYTFYKNQVDVLITILASASNAFSGANVVSPWLMQAYNILHCHLPIFVYGMFDRVAELDVLEMDPKGHSPYLFGLDIQFLWMATAIVQALIITVTWSETMDGVTGVHGPDLAQSSLLGNLCFASVVLCVNVTLVFRQYSWPWMIIACYASNIFCLVASMMVCVNGMSEILGPNWLRVSLTVIISLAMTTLVGEVMVSFMEVFDQESSEQPMAATVPAVETTQQPFVETARPSTVHWSRPSHGFAYSEECTFEREKGRLWHSKTDSMLFNKVYSEHSPALPRSTLATVAMSRFPGSRQWGESGDGIELSFVQRSRSLAVPHHTLNHRSW